MELIKTIREKQQTKRQTEIHQQAVDAITLSDFDNNLYIAYNGMPLIAVESASTTNEILQELAKIRQNYINVRMKEGNVQIKQIINQ